MVNNVVSYATVSQKTSWHYLEAGKSNGMGNRLSNVHVLAAPQQLTVTFFQFRARTECSEQMFAMMMTEKWASSTADTPSSFFNHSGI